MKSMPTFVFAAALALGACAGSQTKQDTLDDKNDEIADSLSAEECGSMVDHMASLSEDLDREAALTTCSDSGTRAAFDCVMAAEDQSAIDTCGGETEDTDDKVDDGDGNGDDDGGDDAGDGDDADDADDAESDG